MSESETTFCEVISENNLKKKVINCSEYKGKRYLRFLEMWREDPGKDWKFCKKIVSFNYLEYSDLVSNLKDKKIEKFSDLLLVFNPEEEKNHE